MFFYLQIDEMIEKEISIKSPRQSLHSYSPQCRAQIGRYAAENRNISAVRKYSKELKHAVPESTVRGFKKKYLKTLKETKTSPAELPHALRSRPLKLGTLDAEVKKTILRKRDAGCVINKTIVKATATAIVKFHMPRTFNDLLPISDTWVKSILTRMNMVKRKGMC